MAQHTAHFPSEVRLDHLKFGVQKMFRAPHDWNMPVTYNGMPLQIQTPIMRNVFGLREYTNAGGRSAYSMSLALDANGDVGEFRAFLEHFDAVMTQKLQATNYYSSIRPSTKPDRYAPTLRVKVKERNGYFQCDFLEGHVPVASKVSAVHMRKNARCRLCLELMPVWSAGSRIGTSWKVVSCQTVVSPAFRDPPPTFVIEENSPIKPTDLSVALEEAVEPYVPLQVAPPLLRQANVRTPPMLCGPFNVAFQAPAPKPLELPKIQPPPECIINFDCYAKPKSWIELDEESDDD